MRYPRLDKSFTFFIVLFASIAAIFLTTYFQPLRDRIWVLYHLAESHGPVVSDMRVTNGYEKDGKLTIRVVGRKLRSCGPPLSINGYYNSNKTISITFLDDVTEDGQFKAPDENLTSKNSNWVDFGWWRIDPYPDDKDLSIYVIHECHGILVRTLIGPFNKSEYIKLAPEDTSK